MEGKLLDLEGAVVRKPTAMLLRQLEMAKAEYRATAEKEARNRLQTVQCRLYETGDKAGKLLAWFGRKEREAS
ncbi:hypothetical protein NDU88_006566 [Pleurodeles waltl]|uniref:Uncharacterized protein n=1 Tax=Pleurodeles waltl TaxID=8319 RepID=A0AAV7WAZ9_PLEWA|nr:hypothetical protein NDU88_006566 [Pleurodeles waltl]